MNIIIRKPKFLRDDEAMALYISIANEAAKVATMDGITLEHKYEMLRQAGKMINMAAKAGGFFSTRDMSRWIATHA